jgi:hypothetical protein
MNKGTPEYKHDQRLVEQLKSWAPNGEYEGGDEAHVLEAVGDLRRKGWLPDEIIMMLRNLEHVNPTLPENIALARMLDVRKKVTSRQEKA